MSNSDDVMAIRIARYISWVSTVEGCPHYKGQNVPNGVCSRGIPLYIQLSVM